MREFLLPFALFAAGCESVIVPQFSSPGHITGTSFGIPGLNATFDYVIFGGGLAGSVIASRLTQHSNASVALVEAGSFYEFTNGNWSQIPYWSEKWVGAAQDAWQPKIDWGLFTEPQINGKRIHYAQGRNLGGSSGRNQILYHRPTVGTMQTWADHVADQSWTWDNMTKFMERSMHFNPNVANRTTSDGSNVCDADAYSAKGGPLQVSFPGFIQPLSWFASQAFASTGLKQLPGFSSGDLDGYGWWQFTIDAVTGLRSSTQNTFLTKAIGRRGLTTYINSQARNIIFNNGTATGVNITVNGNRPFSLMARREVIVSAGAWHSPQLLMVSGVGLRETLEKFDIQVVKDLPGVGQNMWDSCNVGGVRYKVSVPGYSFWQRPGNMERADAELLANGTGPLTNISLDIGGWDLFPDRSILSEKARNDLSIFPSDWPLIEHSVSSTSRNVVSTDTQEQFGSIGNIVIAPLSRGNMTISSASNLDPPIISPNWLQHETDQEVAIAGYKQARLAWQAIPEGIRIGEEVFPGTNVTTDAQLLEVIKAAVSPIHHALASCAMGKADNPMAVVDSKARVFGVKSLRVIDLSSLPFTPPGHTQGVTYFHAEKLVQDVLDEYNEQYHEEC